MKKGENGYRPEKVSFGEYLKVFKGIRLPWLFIILIFVATMGTTIASLSVTFFTGDMVDAQGNVPTAQLVSFVLGYMAMAACAAGNTIFTGIASERINLGLRKKLWRKIIYTKQSCYDIDGGETLVSRVTADCDYASKLLTTIIAFLSLAVSLATYVSQMYALNVTIANYTMLLIPFSVLIGWGYTKLRFLVAQKTQAMLARTTAYLAERTQNLNLVKTSNAQATEITLGAANFQEQYIMQIKAGLMNAFYTSLQTLYNIVSIVIPFVVGAGLVASGVVTVGDVITVYGIAGSVGVAFTNVINDVGIIREANGALARVIRTTQLPDEQNVAGRELDEPDADITFENVQFAYRDKQVLKNVSFQIPKHKVTALIGVNGAGKSTVFKLLDRLYEPKAGTIRFGGTPSEEYDLHAWRKAFGMVAQDSPVLEGTVRENMCYGCDRDVTDEELIKVAKLSRVYDFVSRLPDQFETLVASGGQNFSGGQRQCIAIARAMINSPDYLLLDEATSSLDAKSERMVMEALQALTKSRTTIVIAHSLATIRQADHVIVLRDGEVEASGAPQQILDMSGNYLAKVMNRKCPQKM